MRATQRSHDGGSGTSGEWRRRPAAATGARGAKHAMAHGQQAAGASRAPLSVRGGFDSARDISTIPRTVEKDP
jgi:hypothetical protein